MFLSKSKLATAVMCGLLSMSVLMAGCGGGAKKDSGNTIKIGVVSELTGPNASYGNSVVKGMKLAVKEINDKGGISGKKIELAIADDKSEPAEAANAMSKVLNQDKAKLAMGIFTSSNAIAACNVSESAKVPFLAIGATNPKVTLDKDGKAKPNTFRVCFIDPFQGTVGANFVLDTLKLKKAVVLIDNSSDYSKGLAAFFKEAFTKKGGQILGEEAYLQKDTDFKAILTKIKTLNPEILYVPGYYEEVGKIIKQARELDIKAAFVGGDGWDSPKLVEIAGGPALENTYFTNHYSPDATNAESKAFVAAYQKEYNEKPDAPAVLGYDGAKLMADAITRAGSTDGAKVSAALAATKDFPAVTGKTSLNATHDAVKSAVIIAFKDGKQTYKTTVNP